MKRYLALAVLFTLGVGAAVGLAQTGETTGTVTACATVTAPAHTVEVDGSAVHTIPEVIASQCETVTYTVPTVTVTTEAPPPPPPPPPADTTPPLKPVLSLGPVTQTSMVLNWQPGVDNVGVDHYNVFLDGAKIGETTELSWTYTGLSCGTSYAQGLTVEDAAGNTSNLAEATWSRSTLACDQPSPTGRTVQPGQSWNTAYQTATCGEVINVAQGEHGAQQIFENAILSLCSQDVVFRASGSVTMTGVLLGTNGGGPTSDAPDRIRIEAPSSNPMLVMREGVGVNGDAQYITLDRIDGGTVSAYGDLNQHWVIRNSDWGGCVSSGAGTCDAFLPDSGQIELVGISDYLLENNRIHDYDTVCYPNPQGCDHFECIRGGSPRDIVLRSNRFWNCEIYAWGSSMDRGPTTFLFENNWFGSSNEASGSCRGTSLGADATIPAGTRVIIRNNSFSACDSLTSEGAGDYTGYEITGNIFGRSALFPGQCLVPNALYKYNLFQGPTKCGDATNVANYVPPYVNPARNAALDYHLAGPSLADGFVPAPYCVGNDVDGQPRVSPCDAGSDER